MLAPSATRSWPWQAEPRRLWSLLDMLQFYSSDLTEAFRCVHHASKAVAELEKTGNPEHVSALLQHCLANLRAALGQLQLSPTVEATFQRLRDRIRTEGLSVPANRDVVLLLVEEFETSVLIELRSYLYLAVPFSRKDLYEQNEPPFGAKVASKFPDANRDIASGARCLALDEWAASVFHAVRSAEHGLRALFTHLGLTIPNRPNLEDADWSELITGLTNKVIALGTPRRGSPEQKMIETYNALLSDARYLKDRRNETMHPRLMLGEPEATIAFGRVRDFLQRIAEVI
jgi:hypothetical protein